MMSILLLLPPYRCEGKRLLPSIHPIRCDSREKDAGKKGEWREISQRKRSTAAFWQPLGKTTEKAKRGESR
jgi:hypothetical protein